MKDVTMDSAQEQKDKRLLHAAVLSTQLRLPAVSRFQRWLSTENLAGTAQLGQVTWEAE